MAGESAGLGPQAPRQRQTRPALGPPARDHRVRGGVGGGVVGLSRVAEHAGSRREDDERLQVAGQLVEVGRTRGLGSPDGVEPVGGERGDHTVVEHTRRVHHRRHRILRQQRRHGLPIRHITRHNPHRRTELGQLGDHSPHTGSIRTTTTDQHQLPDTMLSNQMTREQHTQRAGTTRDQHPAVRVERAHRGAGGPGQAGCEHAAFAHDHLGLVGGGRLARECGVVGQQQGDAAGVFGVGGAEQATQCPGDEVVRGDVDDHRPVAGTGVLDGGQRSVECGTRRCLRVAGIDAQHGGLDGTAERGLGEFAAVESGSGAGGGDLLDGGQRAQGERVDVQDERTGRVDHAQREGVLSGGGEPDQHVARSHGAERDTLPGEREPGRGRVGDEPSEAGGVQGGIDQRRVRAESGGGVLGQPDLGVDVVAVAPRLSQASERRPVDQPDLGQIGIGGVDGDGFGPGGRPLGVRWRGGDVGEHTGGVAGPPTVRVPGVDREGGAAVGGRADGELHVHALVRNDEGNVQRQLVDAGQVDLVGGVQCQFEDAGAGEDHLPRHDVVGQPGLCLGAESAGEQHTLFVGQRGQRGQQRVTRGGQPGMGQGTPRHRAGGPEAGVLERVGRQVDALPTGDDSVPVGRRAVDDGLAQGELQPAQAAVVAGERADREHVLGQSHGQYGVRRALDERAESLGRECGDGVGEPHRRAQVVEPVTGVQGRAVLDPAGQRRVHRNRPRVRPNRLQGLQKLLAQSVHLRRVRGIVDRDPLRPDLVGRTGGDQLLQRLRLARHHSGGGAVDRRDRDPLPERFDPLPHSGLVQRDRHHPATPREPS